MGRDTSRKALDKRKKERAQVAELVHDFESPNRRANEAHAWADAQYRSAAMNLTNAERRAVEDYQTGFLMDNDYDGLFYQQKSQSEVSDYNKRLIAEMMDDNNFAHRYSRSHISATVYENLVDTTRRHGIKESVILYRGESDSSPTFDGIERGSIVVGSVIRRGNFMSTGVVKERRFYESDDTGVQLKIKAPKGSKMLYLDTIVGSTWQYEMVLPPRSGLKITKIVEKVVKNSVTGRNRTVYEVEAEIIDDGSKA